MEINENPLPPVRPLSRAVAASRVLAVMSIAIAALVPLTFWLAVFGRYFNYSISIFAGHAIGWLTALAAYALTSPVERALPIAAFSVNVLFNGGMLLFMWLLDAAFSESLRKGIPLFVVFDFVLPVAAFFVITAVKFAVRRKKGE